MLSPVTGLPKLAPYHTSLVNTESRLCVCQDGKLLLCYYDPLDKEQRKAVWQELSFAASLPGEPAEGYMHAPCPPPLC